LKFGFWIQSFWKDYFSREMGLAATVPVFTSGVSAGSKEFRLRQSVKRTVRQRPWSQFKASRRFSPRTLLGGVILGFQSGARTTPFAIEHRRATVLQIARMYALLRLESSQ